MTALLSQAGDWIKDTASILTAGSIICGFAMKFGKGILNKTLDKKLEPFGKRIDDLDKARQDQHNETNQKFDKLQEELNKNSLNTMKNTICNDNIPLPERLQVGKEYIDKGGNGAVKILIHRLEEDYEKKLKKDDKL